MRRNVLPIDSRARDAVLAQSGLEPRKACNQLAAPGHWKGARICVHRGGRQGKIRRPDTHIRGKAGSPIEAESVLRRQGGPCFL